MDDGFFLSSTGSEFSIETTDPGKPLGILGFKFTANTIGQLLSGRYYKPSGESSGHFYALWKCSSATTCSSATLVEKGIYASETTSGWQNQAFSSPVTVAAGDVFLYGVTYNLYYAFIDPYYNTARTSSQGGLTAVPNSQSVNGVYDYTWTFATATPIPANSFQTDTYGRDVVFQSGTITPIITGPAVPQTARWKGTVTSLSPSTRPCFNVTWTARTYNTAIQSGSYSSLLVQPADSCVGNGITDPAGTIEASGIKATLLVGGTTGPTSPQGSCACPCNITLPSPTARPTAVSR